jgi:hypothetical protein
MTFHVQQGWEIFLLVYRAGIFRNDWGMESLEREILCLETASYLHRMNILKYAPEGIKQ